MSTLMDILMDICAGNKALAAVFLALLIFWVLALVEEGEKKL